MNSNAGNGRTVTTVQGVDAVLEDHQTLEQVRHRFNTLSRSIETFLMKDFLHPTEPPRDGTMIPPWTDINTAQRTITGNLQSLQTLLTENSSFLRSAHVHPNATFPWFKDEMNAQLLRKRLNPEVQNWVDKRRRTGSSLGEKESSKFPSGVDAVAVDPQERMTKEDWGKLWDFAAPEASEIARKVFPELDPEYEGDEEEYGEMEGVAKDVVTPPNEPMPLDDVMKLMSSGVVGQNRGGR